MDGRGNKWLGKEEIKIDGYPNAKNKRKFSLEFILGCCIVV
jgi:hypothetical protein